MTKNDYLQTPVDYDLHGIVGIRLLNATSDDERMVTHQLGLTRSTFTREPDIVIRFVDHLVLSSPIRYLGVDDAGFTDDAFLVLRGKHNARVKVQVPFAQIGQQCEILCEKGVTRVPLLIAIVNLTALSKGVIPMHASAFRYKGAGVLTTGWAKGGKTETLLAFMANGATYVGDEWVYLSRDGKYMYGVPEPIKIWDWHLHELPQYQARVGRSDRIRWRLLRRTVNILERIMASNVGGGSAPMKLLKRGTPILKQQLYVQIPPRRLFDQGVGPLTDTLDKIFFVASHETPVITVQPMDPQEIAQRMVFSLQEERMDLMAYYRKFRFAFPAMRNDLIEQAEELQREILTRILAHKDAYAVYHPYPVSIPALFTAINPYLS